MNTYYITLIAIFTLASLAHAVYFSLNITRKFVPYLFNKQIDWNPNIDRLKLFCSSVLFICPILLMKPFIKINSTNIIFNHSGLTCLILLAIFCFWLDTKKISTMKEFKNILTKKKDKKLSSFDIESSNLKTKKEKELRKIETKQNNFENLFIDTQKNISKINNKIDKINDSLIEHNTYNIENIKDLKNEFENKTKSIDNNIGNLTIEVEKIKTEVLKKVKTIDFKLFFESDDEFDRTIQLLYSNNFFSETKKPTVTQLTILICKLDELKTIKYYRKQNHLCIAIAKHFKINRFDESNLTNALKDYKNESFSDAHKEIFNNLDYLKKANK